MNKCVLSHVLIRCPSSFLFPIAAQDENEAGVALAWLITRPIRVVVMVGQGRDSGAKPVATLGRCLFFCTLPGIYRLLRR